MTVLWFLWLTRTFFPSGDATLPNLVRDRESRKSVTFAFLRALRLSPIARSSVLPGNRAPTESRKKFKSTTVVGCMKVQWQDFRNPLFCHAFCSSTPPEISLASVKRLASFVHLRSQRILGMEDVRITCLACGITTVDNYFDLLRPRGKRLSPYSCR